MKWHSEFVRHYNENLDKTAEKMKQALKLFLADHLATIKRRGKPCLKTIDVSNLMADYGKVRQTTLFAELR
jgi:hypothetical protein